MSPTGELPNGPISMGEGALPAEADARHRVLVALSKIGLALRSRAWKETEPRSLNPTQAQLLVALHRASSPTLRLSSLADRLGITAPTASVSVAALERKGLVSKGRAEDDARALAIGLTPAGVDEASRLDAWPDLLLGSVDVLAPDEQAVLLRGLVKIIRELQERGEIAPARMCVTCSYFRPHAHGDRERPHHCAFVDAPFGDADLRIDCSDHDTAEAAFAGENWQTFTSGGTR